MSVIVEVHIPSEKFELGRILELDQGTTVTLETLVPMGEQTVPFFSVHDDTRADFEKTVREHPSVDSLQEVSSGEDTTLYALDWQASRDTLFEGFRETEAQIRNATGTRQDWYFELRFPSHESLAEFQEYCSNSHIPLEVDRLYNPTKPSSGPFFGLSEPQRKTLVRAVEAGYYSIPRTVSTQALAEEFDISDQAVTERLRRAIMMLVESTLIAAEQDEKDD